MSYVCAMDLSNVICIECQKSVMSVSHALVCLRLSYIPVEVKKGDDVLVSRGFTEGIVNGSVYVTDLDTNECDAYPVSWVVPK